MPYNSFRMELDKIHLNKNNSIDQEPFLTFQTHLIFLGLVQQNYRKQGIVYCCNKKEAIYHKRIGENIIGDNYLVLCEDCLNKGKRI